MQADLFHEAQHFLGEGPLWTGDTLAYFDILEGNLHFLDPGGLPAGTRQIGRFASAMALTDGDDLLIATETDLARIAPGSDTVTTLIPLEADNPVTRSNDGRADRQGGFWIGTMGTGAEPEAGALYRYFNGHLRCLRRGLTIPNAICFSPDGTLAYFADSALNSVYRWRLDDEGWPVGAPTLFFRTDAGAGAPDGAVIDSQGAMWIALWGSGRVQRIQPNGVAGDSIAVPASHVTCPAFGPDNTLFITTARQGLTDRQLTDEPLSGSVFRASIPVPGLSEPKVRLK